MAASASSKYYWPLLGQEPMVTHVEGSVPTDFLPAPLHDELTAALHLAPGVRIHTLLVNTESVLAYTMEDTMEETQVVSSLLVSFHTSPDLHIQRETTFRISFLSDYPETPPVVHLLVDGQCNDVLLDQYDDPRLDPSRRGTLYMLRICNPADGWMASSYTVECVIFALRWTLTKIQSPSAVCKITPTSRLGTLFDRDPHSKDGPLRPNANGAHLICSCLHHEEQGYRDSMEDVVLGLDESNVNGLVNRKHDLPYRLYAVFDGHGGDYSAHYAGKHLPQYLQTNVVDHHKTIRESIFDACRKTDGTVYPLLCVQLK